MSDATFSSLTHEINIKISPPLPELVSNHDPISQFCQSLAEYYSVKQLVRDALKQLEHAHLFHSWVMHQKLLSVRANLFVRSLSVCDADAI
jgi:hypothetical protein